MELNLLSIIVPVYNAEKYIRECLFSILNQNYRQIEVIVVDDGSTDKTVEIVKKMMEEDSRIKYFYKTNGGVSSARNLGLDNSNGEFISFVDADDTVCKNIYSEMIPFLKENKCDIVCCGVNVISFDGNIISKNICQECDIDAKNALNECLFGEKLNFAVYDKVFDSKLFNGKEIIRFPEKLTMEEATILPNIFFKSNRIHHVGKALYNYFMREGSYVNKPLSEEVYRIFDIISLFKEEYSYNAETKKAIEYFEIRNSIELYRRAVLEKNIIQKDVYAYLKNQFHKIYKKIFFSRVASFKLKIMAIETNFHLHVLRKGRRK